MNTAAGDGGNLKGGILLSLMFHMLTRSTFAVVIALAAFVLISGCSSNSKSPREKANEAVAKANKSVARHNKLFEQSRNTYNSVKTKLESGKDPSDQKKSITEARDTLEKATANLKDAKESLKSVQDLDVNGAVKKYTSLLSAAMGDQISAEDKEAQFYGILEKDPALKNSRKKAEELLTEVSKGYEKSREAYKKAKDYARSHPNIVALPTNTTGASTGGSSTTTISPSTNPTTVGGTT